jgi:hypothetical protein
MSLELSRRGIASGTPKLEQPEKNNERSSGGFLYRQLPRSKPKYL